MADNNKDKKDGWEGFIQIVVWFNGLFKQEENSKVGLVCLWIMESVILFIVAYLLGTFVFKDFTAATSVGSAVAVATIFTLFTSNEMKKK